MAEDGRPQASAWGWALVLVASLQLLTTAGTWVVTDQAEALFTARRLLTAGTLDLAPDGAKAPRQIPWAPGSAGKPLRSRLLPLPALSLTPLLWLDRRLGLEDPTDYGRVVHLQGHLFVLATLALLGFAVKRAGGEDSGAAMAVVLAGLAWPVWMASRNGGAEPILALLVMIVASLGPDGADLRGELPLAARGAALALLSWTNPSGSVLAVALAAASWWPGREPRRSVLWLCFGTATGIASVMVLWNALRHGSPLLGGYHLVTNGDYFLATSPLRGGADYARSCLEQGPFLLSLALLGAASRGRRSRRELVSPFLLLLAVTALFATYYSPEPERRLAAVWPVFGLSLGRGWPALGWRSPAAQLTLAAAGLLGFHFFFQAAGHYYPGPGNLYYPGVLWVKLALDHGLSLIWALPVLLLSATSLLSGERVFALVRG
jgi:hypothetical protein